MSRQTFEKEIRKELERLNKRIDEKIIQGLSYAVEARRHRQLISKIMLKRPSFFSRMFSFV